MLTRSCTASQKINGTQKANESLFFQRQKTDDRSASEILQIEILMLQGYLSVRNISYLDIAICNVDLRSLFLNSLQSVKIRDDTRGGTGDNFVEWIIERQIKILNFMGHP
jgi:hypothetical protein